MSAIINVHEAKTQLSKLLEAVERGEEFVIARAGKPVAVLSAFHARRRQIAPPGSLAGQHWQIAEDFDEPVDTLFDCLSPDVAR